MEGVLSNSAAICAIHFSDPWLQSRGRLKLLDYDILDIWGEQLASDSLQFGYKRGTSTTDKIVFFFFYK